MKALLLVAHGSRRAQSNKEVVDMAQMLEKRCSKNYPIIKAGFLEIAEPSIPEGIARCKTQGASSVVILPYFLNRGRHLTKDIPALVEQAQKDHPQLAITIAEHVGASQQMLDILVSLADTALEN